MQIVFIRTNSECCAFFATLHDPNEFNGIREKEAERSAGTKDRSAADVAAEPSEILEFRIEGAKMRRACVGSPLGDR